MRGVVAAGHPLTAEAGARVLRAGGNALDGAAREGVELTPMAASFLEILGPILTATPEGSAIYAPAGRLLKTGERIRMVELADLLERYGAEGPGFAYTGDVARAVSAWVLER